MDIQKRSNTSEFTPERRRSPTVNRLPPRLCGKKSDLVQSVNSGQMECAAEHFGDGGDALPRRCGHFLGVLGGIALPQHHPNSRMIDALVVADCAGELRDFKVAARELAFQGGTNLIE